jgi:hypothetical protein
MPPVRKGLPATGVLVATSNTETVPLKELAM